jgi:hypothetical protein
MVTLCGAAVTSGAATAAACVAFQVDIDASQSVGHLKETIKEKTRFPFPAHQMKLFLAKKDDEWLTEAAVKSGGSTDGLTLLQAAWAEVGDVGLSEKQVQFRATKEHATTQTTPVHVLVVAPSSEVGSKRPANDGLPRS